MLTLLDKHEQPFNGKSAIRVNILKRKGGGAGKCPLQTSRMVCNSRGLKGISEYVENYARNCARKG